MSKLQTISSDPVIREYAQGAAQSATSAVADFLAPTVSVATSTGKYKKYTEKHRFAVPDTRRSVGGRATEVGFAAADATYNCEPHALDFPVDHLEQLEEAGLRNTLTEAADMLAAIGALAHERDVISKALAAAGSGTALSIGGSDDVVAQLDADILSVIEPPPTPARCSERARGLKRKFLAVEPPPTPARCSERARGLKRKFLAVSKRRFSGACSWGWLRWHGRSVGAVAGDPKPCLCANFPETKPRAWRAAPSAGKRFNADLRHDTSHTCGGQVEAQDPVIRQRRYHAERLDEAASA